MVSPNNGGLMKDVAFRQALSTSINRANLIQVMGGPTLNHTLTNVLPANVVGGEQGFDPYPYDAAKGKQMLSAAGGDGATIKILYRNGSQNSTKTFQTVQQALTEQELKVEGIASPNADFCSKYLHQTKVAKPRAWD